MRKSNIFKTISVVGVALLFNFNGMAQGNNKIEICHHPPGMVSNHHTISISMNALQAHLAHGDVVGPCIENVIHIVTPYDKFNPLFGQINVEYNLYRPSSVKIEVYDKSGNRIKTIAPNTSIVGKYTQVINPEDIGFPKGMYFVKVSVTSKFGTTSKSKIIV